jgi:moderate conductance mechanosensitive channel
MTALTGGDLATRGLAIVLLTLAALLTRWLVHRAIDRVVRRTEAGVLPGFAPFGNAGASEPSALARDRAAAQRRTARARAMGSLLKSIVTVFVFTILALTLMAVLGLPIAPLLASAGVLGVAFGIGAQNLVKDFLAGIFMILEDQYGVGDLISLGETTGTVEAVSLRVTRLRDDEGVVWYVRNGEVVRVGNRSDQGTRVTVDVSVAPGEDPGEIRRTLEQLCTELWEDGDLRGLVAEPPTLTEHLGSAGEDVSWQIHVETAPEGEWRVPRELRRRIRAHLADQGVRGVRVKGGATRSEGADVPETDDA